jgi:thiopurine S-methyltransferase
VDPEFWQQRWLEGRIGFHQDRPTPLLEQHWAAIDVAAGSRVLVPLAGKSLDLPWLAARGHRVLGVELSPIAVEQFFAENALTPTVRETRDGTRYVAGAIELIRGDVFALDAGTLAGCDAVYDRAALIALPPDLRRRYADEVYGRLPAGCRGLLVTLEYPEQEKSGPPFPVDAREMQALFGRDWSLELLERRDILAEQPGFVAEGVSALHTSAWRMQRR